MVRAALFALIGCIAVPARAATGDPLPPEMSANLVFDVEFGKSLDDLGKQFFQGIGPYAGQPQTQMHIGTGELQIAANGNYLGLGIQPFSVQKGYLAAMNGPLTDAQRSTWLDAVDRASAKDSLKPKPGLTKYVPNMRTVSQYGWSLTTRRTFKQPFYVEYRAKLPTAGGQWPGFYVYDFKMAPFWPVEIDAMEAPEKPGGKCYYATLHDKGLPNGKLGGRVCTDSVLAGTWHRYGVFVEGPQIIWYFDGKEVLRQFAPGYSHYNFSVVLTNSVGGSWPQLVNNPFQPGSTSETGLGSLKVWTR